MVQAAAMGQGCGIIPGDRIAHMSHFRGLYGTFVFFTLALMEMPQPIQENGKKGTIVVSYLVKRQQRVIRYPTGTSQMRLLHCTVVMQ